MNTRWFDRIIYGGAWKQIRFLLFLVIFLILFFSLCVYWGSEHMVLPKEELSNPTDKSFPAILWNVYNYFVDSGNQVNINSEDRIWGLFISMFGSIVLGGLLISTISNIIERRVENCRKGLIHYTLSDHIVIIGADAMLPSLVRQLLQYHKQSKIVIQTAKDVDDVRMKLYSQLTPKEERNVIFNYARRDSKEELKALCVTDANEVFILGDSGELDDVEYYHDSMNVDCLNLIGILCKEKNRKTPLKCNVLFEYQSTFTAFQFSDLSSEIKEYIEFHPYNFYETWAQKVLVRNYSQREFAYCLPDNSGNEKIEYKPLDYEPITYESDKYVHLVIVGMSKMGIAMAIEAAHIAHYPNFIRNKKKKTRITFIDRNAGKEMDAFKQAYSNLFDVSYSYYIDTDTGTRTEQRPLPCYQHLGNDFIDMEWQFVQGNIESSGVRQLITDWCNDECALITLAICLNFMHHSIATAMFLPECVREKNIPVNVQQRITSAIIDNVSGGNKPGNEENNCLRFKNLKPFGMLNDCLDLYMPDRQYAKRVHYVYATYDAQTNRLPDKKPSQAEVDAKWAELKKERIIKQWSNIYNANSIPTKLRSIGYEQGTWKDLTMLTEEQINLLSQVEHNRWNVEELLLGYRPVTLDEQIAIERNYDVMKKEMRDCKFIHYDIREYALLKPQSRKYDLAITTYIPFIINGYMS